MKMISLNCLARGAVVAAAVTIPLLFAGCNKPSGDQPGADGGTIRIGEFASLTGKEATFGTSSHEGTLMAIEELNAAGGVLGESAASAAV